MPDNKHVGWGDMARVLAILLNHEAVEQKTFQIKRVSIVISRKNFHLSGQAFGSVSNALKGMVRKFQVDCTLVIFQETRSRNPGRLASCSKPSERNYCLLWVSRGKDI